MDIRYLETLEEINRCGSFAKAAEKLNYTRSTVTVQVQQLEKEFGIKLFEQIGKKMVLTDEGSRIMPYVEQVLANYRQILICSREEVRKLRITVPESLLIYRLQSVIATFREKMPEIDLQIQTESCYHMNRIILNGGTDLAFHYDVGKPDPNITDRKLAEYPLTPFGSPDMSEKDRDFLTPDQKKPFSVIDIETDGIYRASLENALKERHISFAGNMVLGSITAILQCVKLGLGVSALPDFAVKKEIEKGELLRLDTDLSPATIGVMCSYHSHKRLSPAMKYFISLVEEMI